MDSLSYPIHRLKISPAERLRICGQLNRQRAIQKETLSAQFRFASEIKVGLDVSWRRQFMPKEFN